MEENKSESLFVVRKEDAVWPPFRRRSLSPVQTLSFTLMQQIRNIITQANQKVLESDLQSALGLYEAAFTESQKEQYIPGMFCCSRRLGDIYYYSVEGCTVRL